jgi:ferrochelatase
MAIGVILMKKGVLLVNLGTPDAPRAPEVRRYLSQFLADQRVIDTPKILWWPILHGIILRFRPRRSAALYRRIWTAQGSPLAIYTAQQTKQLQALMPEYLVQSAMCYSQPTINTALTAFQEQGVRELTIIPMYPQYSQTTIGSVFDQVMAYYRKRPDVADLHFVRGFYQREDYIQLLVQQLQQALQQQDYDQLIFSYHGIPQKYADNGDPYAAECTATTEAVMAQLGDYPYVQTYQSKFGPAQWLLPATIDTLRQLPAQGHKKVLVITPSFVADCLETLQEIEIENKTAFLESGGEQFNYIHPLNSSADFTAVLKKIALNQN